jgi:hypothetical protein
VSATKFYSTFSKRVGADDADPALIIEKKEITMDVTKLDQVVKLASDIDSGRITGNFATKSQWFLALKALAEETRLDGETPEQALAHYIKTEEGHRVYKCYRSAPGEDYRPAAPAPAPAPVVKTADAAALKIAKIAADYRDADPSLSRSAALAAVRQNHPELWAQTKLEAA